MKNTIYFWSILFFFLAASFNISATDCKGPAKNLLDEDEGVFAANESQAENLPTFDPKKPPRDSVKPGARKGPLLPDDFDHDGGPFLYGLDEYQTD